MATRHKKPHHSETPHVDRPRPGVVKISVYTDGSGITVDAEDSKGVVIAEIEGRFEPWTGCDDDAKVDRARVRELGHRIGGRVLVVYCSEIRDLRYIRTGLGVELYIALARTAAEEFGAVVMPHRCIAGGHTSEFAERVWKSRRFNAVVIREGDSAYWIGEAR